MARIVEQFSSTIAAGDMAGSAVDMKMTSLHALSVIIPPTFNGTARLQASLDGDNWYDVYDASGALITPVVGACTVLPNIAARFLAVASNVPQLEDMVCRFQSITHLT